MSGNINENTFVGLTYHELSQEGFGLPSIRSLRAPSKKELFNAPIVKTAAAKAKAYGIKKHYTNDIPTSQKDKELYIISILAKRGVEATEKEIANIAKKIEFTKIDGLVVVNCDALMTSGDNALFAFALIACGITDVFASLNIIIPASVATFFGTTATTGNPIVGAAASGAVLGTTTLALSVIELKAVSFLKKKLIEKNIRKDLHIFTSWVAFKNDKRKVVLKRFCNAIIDPKMYVPGREDLEVSDESDDVSMTDLVEDETTVEEDAGKDSVTTDTSTVTQADTAHNEEASSGGVVTPENQDELEVEPTETDTNSTEAWNDAMYSLEEVGDDDVCMDCLVEDETTVEEDAGKDSEVKDANPTEAETAHNEEASSGGVLTGENKDDLEVQETSEEDYDIYSDNEYQSLEGVFDPDDLEQ